jgi:hypothetical protein
MMLDLVAVNALLVAALAALVAAGAWRALLRTGNATIGYVVAGFLVLAGKNLLKAFLWGSVGEEAKEVAFSLLDLAAVLLIAYPLVLRRRGP